jgi:hypothetical protein
MPKVLLLVGIELVDFVGGQDPVEEAEIGDTRTRRFTTT